MKRLIRSNSSIITASKSDTEFLPGSAEFDFLLNAAYRGGNWDILNPKYDIQYILLDYDNTDPINSYTPLIYDNMVAIPEILGEWVDSDWNAISLKIYYFIYRYDDIDIDIDSIPDLGDLAREPLYNYIQYEGKHRLGEVATAAEAEAFINSYSS